MIREVEAPLREATPTEVRRILSASHPHVEFFRFLFLTGARASEVLGGHCPSDSANHYGVTGADLEVVDYKGHRIYVFHIRTAKRKGKPRSIAIPDTEPLLQGIPELFHSAGRAYVWPYTRQYMWLVARRIFNGYGYRIEGERLKPFALHALRHIRATELVQRFGFSPLELAVYMGWTLRSVGWTSVTERYISLNWQLYIDKLLAAQEQEGQ